MGSNAAANFIGFTNYINAFTNPAFKNVAKVTVVWLVGVAVGGVLLGLIIALLLERPLLGIGAFRTAFYIPVVIDWIVASIIWEFILHPNVGVVNSLLSEMGMQKVRFLADPQISLFVLIGVFLWKSAGYYAIFYLAGLQDVPYSLIEAAQIDGANGWQKPAGFCQGAWDTLPPLCWP